MLVDTSVWVDHLREGNPTLAAALEEQGYETDPLSIGMAWTRTPDRATPWIRLAENPVLSPAQPDARPFEQTILMDPGARGRGFGRALMAAVEDVSLTDPET